MSTRIMDFDFFGMRSKIKMQEDICKVCIQKGTTGNDLVAVLF